MRTAFNSYGITSGTVGAFSIISIPLSIATLIASGYIAGKYGIIKPLLVFLGLVVLIIILFSVLLL